MDIKNIKHSYIKIVARKEKKLRKLNQPVPTNAFKSNMNIIAYNHHLDQLLKEECVIM